MIHELYNGAQVRVEDISYLSELNQSGPGFKIIFKSGAEIISSIKICSVDTINKDNRILDRLLDQKLAGDHPKRTNLYFESKKPDLQEVAINSYRELSFVQKFENNYNELLAKLKDLQ